MAERKTRKAPAAAAPSLMRYLPIALLLVLLIFIGAVVGFFILSPPASHYAVAQSSGCVPGDVQNCLVGSCGGISICLGDGTWGGCTWQHVCTPGSVASCIQNGCAYAYRTCNQCGSGYGACAAPNSTASNTG